MSESLATSRRPVFIRLKRFGRNDYERFYEEEARGSRLRVGSACIGKVEIDCKYRWKQAQWGLLDDLPAGIIYMDINFKQPHGYWLKSASVFVTLSEDASSYALRNLNRGQPTRLPLASDYAVQVTEHYGPRLLTGTKTVVAENKTNSFVPSIGAMGCDIGGVGRQLSTSYERSGRWVFRGTVGKPRGQCGLRTLEWELRENELDPGQIHNQEYHTALAFGHSKRPVFMRVEVKGKLHSKGRQLKHDFLRFSTQSVKTDNSTITEISFDKDFTFDKELDEIAKGLDAAMQMVNLQRGPVEVPDAQPAQFFSPADQSLTPPDSKAPVTQPVLADLRPQPELDSDEDPFLSALHKQLQGQPRTEVAAHIGLGKKRGASESESSASETSVTLVNNYAPTVLADEDFLHILLNVPAIVSLLRLLATLVGYFGTGRRPMEQAIDPDTEEEPKESHSAKQTSASGPKMLKGGNPHRLEQAQERPLSTSITSSRNHSNAMIFEREDIW